MGYKVSFEQMNSILGELSSKYRVFGPALDAAKKKVRYKEIKDVSKLVLERQSDFSPKEVFYPISQVMFYFREDDVEESEIKDDRDILIFAHACDINAIRRQDNVFLNNGGQADFFYRRMREKVHYILVECQSSYDNCFCVSVGSNKTDDYAMAVRVNDGEMLINIKDQSFDEYFDAEKADFEVQFIQENKKIVKIPDINKENIKAVSGLEYWNKFDDKCIGCAGCNTVCGTCTCFDTVDVTYEEGSAEGERRRVWSGCMLMDFTRTAGGGLSRKTQGANMRFKVFHKFYDYKARFGSENMCVGCGRCDFRCPQDISFFDTVCELADEIEKLKQEA